MSGYGDVAAVDGYYPQGYYHHGTPFMHHLHHQTQGTVTILTRLTKLETKYFDVPLIKKQKLYQNWEVKYFISVTCTQVYRTLPITK